MTKTTLQTSPSETWLKKIKPLINKNIISLIDKELKKEIDCWYLKAIHENRENYYINVCVNLKNGEYFRYPISLINFTNGAKNAQEQFLFKSRNNYLPHLIKIINELINTHLED